MADELTRCQIADGIQSGTSCCGIGDRPDHPSRRALLRAAGAGAAVATVAVTAAACGSSSNGTVSDPASANAAGGGASASASSGSGGTVLAKTSDIPLDGGKIISSAQVVITQPSAGTYKAFTAVCTHSGCIVTSVSNNQIQCPCHGSVFSATDGSVIQGPAQSPLAAKTITVANGDITSA